MWHTIGHDWAVELLEHALRNEHIGHAYLFIGQEQIGKLTLATEFAAALNCVGAAPPCRECTACRKTFEGSHPDVLCISPQNGRIKIEQIREMQRQTALSPYEGRLRVCLINDLHTATTEAANALLKTLEEPPARVVILLTAVNQESLLPTVVSRCQILQLRPVPAALIEQTLRRSEGQNAQRAADISRWAAGRIGWALTAARDPDVLSAYQKQTEGLLQILSQGGAERMHSLEQLSKRENLREILKLWQIWWRDVVMAASGNIELVINHDQLSALQSIAREWQLEQAAAAYRGTGEALLMLEQNVNPRAVLELLTLRWGRIKVQSIN